MAAAPRAAARGDLLPAALFALAYFAGSEIGYSLSLGPSVGGTFWPPAGISLAVFLASPTRRWPHLLAAGVAANFLSDALHGQVLPASVGFAIANLGETFVGAALLRRLAGPITFTRLLDIVMLGIVAVFLSAPIGAAVGAFAAQWWTQDPPGFPAGWRTWWVGDAVGALVLTPFVFRIISGWSQRDAVPARRWLEGGAFAIAVWAATQVVFTAPPTSVAMPFLVFPVLFWGSLRFGPIGVGGALCLVVLLTTHDTAAGLGPFAAEHLSLGDRLIALQIYLGVMAICFYGLGLLWEERARTAVALRLAHSGLEARYRRIVEQSPLAIRVVQPDGTVQEVNPAWRRLSGSSDARGAADVPPLREDARLEPLVRRAFTGEIVELPEREVAGAADPRASRRIRGFAYPIKDDGGGVAEVVLIERDITDEIRARQQLVDANQALRDREEALSRAVQQMAEAQAHREQLLEAERFARGEAERASTLKDEFLATLSHELRTPLNAIVGWTHILRRNARDPALAQAVDTIERNALAQAKLIDDLLDMSRILAGKVGLTRSRARLEDVVAAAADAVRPAAEAKGVTLALDLTGGRDAWIWVDAARLQQVVTNLLGNGIKFTPAGGRVDASIAVEPNEARLIVRDTGQGIPAEFLPAVFERFRQADGSFSRRHGGLGLGLSITKQIVEMHGGSIAAHSDGPGTGAVFTVTLPTGAAAGGDVWNAQAGDDWPPARLQGLRVLVVDDEADARELLRRLLLEQGCRVTCAASADEACAALAGRPCDVLLTDIGMPEADGYELLRRVRSGAGAQPAALAVTAFARPEDRDRALAAGFDGHVAKPIDPSRLLLTLARLVTPAAPPRGSGPGSDERPPGESPAP